MPARLRMQMIRTHGGDPVDFELWCLAVSVLAAVRIAPVIHALAVVV